MDSNILTVSNVSKRFDKVPEDENFGRTGWKTLLNCVFSRKSKQTNLESFTALEKISFSVPKGNSLGIMGLNGSGKSTLLQIIAGTMQPTYGSIDLRGKVAALLELGSGFNPEFTGLENIKLSASLHGLGMKEIRSKISSIINFADIGDFIYQPVKTYSSGMSLRLAFAIAAHVNSEILIIDEALAVGDARFQIKCFTFLEDFKKKGGSLILVSHDLNSIVRLCEKSLLIHQGRTIKICKSLNVVNEYSKIIADGVFDKTKIEDDLLKNSTRIEKTRQKTSQIGSYGVEPFSYGGEDGLIKNVRINNNKTAIIRSGDKFTVSFDINSKRYIEKPIFALRIRNSKGVEIYGTNTKFLRIHTPSLNEGEKYHIEFHQTANLGIGKYFISIGFTYYEANKLRVVHRLRECNEFEIFNENDFFGLSNCFSKVLIRYKKPS
jgi:ABC-type polysaccharide/polyol phosphate transport system ATPase subunit